MHHAETLVELYKDDFSMFALHLAFEKALKALWISVHHEEAPKIHDLLKIAGFLEFPFTPEDRKILASLNYYSVLGRYDVEEVIDPAYKKGGYNPKDLMSNSNDLWKRLIAQLYSLK